MNMQMIIGVVIIFIGFLVIAVSILHLKEFYVATKKDIISSKGRINE